MLANSPTNDHSAISHFRWQNWRTVLDRFDVLGLAPSPGWISTLYELQQRLVETPDPLATFAYWGATFLRWEMSPALPLLRSRHVACVAHVTQERGIAPGGLITDATLISQSGRIRMGSTGFERQRRRVRLALDVAGESDDMGPARKAEQLDVGNNDARPIETFLDTGEPVNIFRQSQYSPPAIASGIQRRDA